MKIDWFVLLWGIFIILGGGFGVAFPEWALRLDKAIMPRAMRAQVERVMPITPRAVRIWNGLGVLAGAVLVVASLFIGD